MIKVGITGGIGVGKSTVCKVFEHMGVPVFYCDDESKEILAKNIDKVKEVFGTDILNESGEFDKSKLAAIVFNNKDEMKRLTDILYPLVDIALQNFYEKNKDAKICLVENAILFENKTESSFDKVITITADYLSRMRRVIARDKTTEQNVKSRMDNQLPESYKIERSNYVINNHDNCDIIKEVDKVYKQIIHDSIS